MKKKIISIALAMLMLARPVSASVLGSVITSWSHDIAEGTQFYKNTFLSEQSGVGKQAEYYAEYTPNESVVPTVVGGQSLWGMRNIKQAEQYMKDNDMVPLIGINASFFSLQTGLPMGHVISDGRIVSKDTQSYQTIGFRMDGSAFIEPLAIKTTLFFGENSVDIAHINKYNQASMDIINLYTADFAEDTHTDAAALYLILGDCTGNLALGDSVNAVVEEKFSYTGSIKIPADKIVLALNETGQAELYEKLDSINVGDEVTISSKSTDNEELWESAESALGSVGATLVKDGEVQSGFEAGAAPRTAVGITESGNVIFYVIDGRQKPYSYGVQTKTLAKRMKELGCVDAINLDGGGSTAISGIYPGADGSEILNSPSGGSLRKCANYIFLKNAKKATGTLGGLYLYPFEQHYLSGYSETIYPAAVDTAYYKTDLPNDLEFTAYGTESTITDDGVLTARGSGEFDVFASGGGVVGSAKYKTYETPTNINVYNGETNEEIKSLSLKKGDTVKLNLTAQYYYIDLKTAPECFEFEVTDEIGYVKDNRELVITSDGGSGKLIVRAGDYKKEIPVVSEYESVFSDTKTHWAREAIKTVYQTGIISGYEREDGVYFMPDSNMTREEFAVVVCRYLGLENTEDVDLSAFADSDKISEWAKPYVFAVSESGLITGKADGEGVNFAPADTLTRAEAMTILGRSRGDLNDGAVDFADGDEIPVWAKPYISAMVSGGIVSGYADNTIKPNGFVTRAEAVTIIGKLLAEK